MQSDTNLLEPTSDNTKLLRNIILKKNKNSFVFFFSKYSVDS